MEIKNIRTFLAEKTDKPWRELDLSGKVLSVLIGLAFALFFIVGTAI